MKKKCRKSPGIVEQNVRQLRLVNKQQRAKHLAITVQKLNSTFFLGWWDPSWSSPKKQE